MGFVSVNCPKCGAPIEFSSDREFCYCNFCGTKIVQDKLVIEHRGSVKVDGIASEGATLERAFMFISEGDFSSANTYFEKALDLNPKCSRAYYGKILCHMKCKTSQQIMENSSITEKDILWIEQAKNCASPDELQTYLDIEDVIRPKYQKDLEQFETAVSLSDSRLTEAKSFLENNEAKNNRSKRNKIILMALIILASILSLYSLTCIFVGWMELTKKGSTFLICSIVAFLLLSALLVTSIVFYPLSPLVIPIHLYPSNPRPGFCTNRNHLSNN